MEFPRVPLTSDKELFTKLVSHGAKLVSIHLLKSPMLEEFITTFPVAGSNKVEDIRYTDKKVYLNATQYFGGLSEDIWTFKIGENQICNRWLKDRKGRTLSSDDIDHYQRMVVAIQETIRLMEKIDNSITKWPIE